MIRAFGILHFLPASLAADENDDALRELGAVELDIGFSSLGYHFKLAAVFTDVIFGVNDAGPNPCRMQDKVLYNLFH